MDTVEELNGTYIYRGIPNLSAGELFPGFSPDAVNEQSGTSDIVAVAC